MARNRKRTDALTRRTFLAGGAIVAAGTAATAVEPPAHRQASGIKIGEVTDSSARVWVRLTAEGSRNATGTKVVGKGTKTDGPMTDAEVRALHGACPGAAGRVRLRYGRAPDLADARETPWVAVDASTDFTHTFALAKLPANTAIHFAVDSTDPHRKPHGPLTGSFRTALRPTDADTVRFAVVTCQMYADLDHPDGFQIYPAIRELDPRFVVFTGDNVYYDSERPRALTPALARYHWQRLYSLPRHVELLRNVASYWEKDDHDTLKDDSWPGQKMGDLTFAEGQAIFRQQVPMGETIYRTFRWGQFLQVWLTDGRDFRSPNSTKDGPEKTIWGPDQKAWLFRTLAASDATWKVIVSPTPIVGPDRAGKGDNHANKAFRHEGDEIRAWLKANAPANAFVICGDRHWQYHSVHPESGLNEFSVGAASDAHAGGTPGENPAYHKFHRVKGGFLSVAAGAESIAFEHRDVRGTVVYRYEKNVK